MPEDAAVTRRQLLEQVQSVVDLSFPYELSPLWERISVHGAGDCKQYVMEKRARLLDAGVPIEDLRIGVCFAETNEAHAVLIVRDGDGDWVLDQRLPRLATLEDLRRIGYRGIELQVAGQSTWETWEI